MKRIIMMVLRNILLVPWMWAKLCYHASHVDKYTEEEHYRMLQFITHRANKGGNVTIDAHGLENIPEENGFMFFPNHQGLYDVLALVDVCPKPFSVVAKKEVENVPFLKQVFKCMKAYMMAQMYFHHHLRIQHNSTHSDRLNGIMDRFLDLTSYKFRDIIRLHVFIIIIVGYEGDDGS